MKLRKHIKPPVSIRTLLQTIFLSSDFYAKNSLITYSSACGFGFLFALLPVIFLVLIVLIRILHTEQTFIIQLYPYVSMFIEKSQFDKLLNSVFSIKKIGILEIITVISIFWLAQRFFFSITQSFQKIFHNKTPRKNVAFNLWAVLGEVLFIIGAALLIAFFITAKSLFSSTSLPLVFPRISFWIESTFNPFLLSILPLFILFITIIFTYRFIPGTKPGYKLCIISSLCTTLIFFAAQKIFGLFLNTSRYNLIYGVFSKLIVLLLEVGIFFQIFLFFAQYIYVYQFFDSLLLAELYLLPKKSSPDVYSLLRRRLFIKPEKFIKKDESIINLKPGQIIYSENEEELEIYYIASGVVTTEKNGKIQYFESGSFLGDIESILALPRACTMKALTIVQLLRIDSDTFRELQEINPDVAKKIFTQLTKENLTDIQ